MRFLAIVPALLLMEARSTSQLCAPDCTQSLEGHKVRDPTNCLRYYYCSDPEGSGTLIPSLDPISCPSGSYFNPIFSVADCEPIVAGKEYCDDLCSPCDLTCEAAGTLIADAMDCSLYLVCLDDGTTIATECPDDLPFFDYGSGLCTDDPTHCYDLCDPCQLYCAAPGKVADPKDCRKYYYCDPPQLAHFACPEGEVFDPQDLICEVSQTGNCTNIC